MRLHEATATFEFPTFKNYNLECKPETLSPLTCFFFFGGGPGYSIRVT